MITAIEFHKSYSNIQQPDIYVYKNSVFLRKNHKTIVQNGITTWECDEAIITVAEFNEYADFVARQNALKGVDDSENITSLVSSQAMNEFNQLATMEATADLYELMSTNEFNQLATMEAIADLYSLIDSGGAV